MADAKREKQKVKEITDKLEEGLKELFECENIKDIEKEFHEAVDDYLEFCKEVGKEPDKEYKGTFNVRINPELHKKLVNVAMKNEDSLNASVEKAIQGYISSEEYKPEIASSLGKTIIIMLSGEA